MTSPIDKLKVVEISHSNDYFNEINKYKSNLVSKNLPVIYSLPHLCLIAGVNVNKIFKFCQSDRQNYYRRFKLRKKRGGYRFIQTPKDELKYLQKWILINILNKSLSHQSCKGFDPKTSIKKNAEIHLNREAILKIDLLRFYDSLTERRVFGLFKKLGFHPNLSVSIAKICTINPNDIFLKSFRKNELNIKKFILEKNQGILPQGAPSSPKISNLIALNLDNRLYKLSKKNNITYSRYADDLTFSGKIETLRRLKKVVYKIIKDENLFINYSKTKFLIRGNRFFVTGLSVNNSIVTIPKKKKVDIEHHLFHCLKNGVQKHLTRSKIKNRNFKHWLFGNIAFVHSVEKELGEKYFNDFNKIQWPI